MPLTRVIHLALIVAFIIAFLHSVAVAFYLYSFYWWFDIPLHFLGGFCAGLISLYFYSYFHQRKERTMTSFRVLVVVIGSVMTVGFVWEFFEYFAGIASNALGNYTFDTAKDLIMDMLGGYASYLYFIARGIHKNL